MFKTRYCGCFPGFRSEDYLPYGSLLMTLIQLCLASQCSKIGLFKVTQISHKLTFRAHLRSDRGVHMRIGRLDLSFHKLFKPRLIKAGHMHRSAVKHVPKGRGVSEKRGGFLRFLSWFLPRCLKRIPVRYHTSRRQPPASLGFPRWKMPDPEPVPLVRQSYRHCSNSL
jgi:hypothetical protein